MPSLPLVGQDFAGYRLRGVLGRGGMSVVYEAENARLGNTVALKVLAPDLSTDDAFRARFLKESRLAASLNHPNVIPIYDTGPCEDMLYIAMRYVAGSDLRSVLNKHGHISPAQALLLIGQAGRALDAAHRLGLVHRDVKPANILIERGADDDPDHVYLSDFGLTKHTISRSGLTATGQLLGTIDYIAPEQIQGKDVDGRADIYSLGCVLYECITGRVPFVKDVEAAVIWAHVEEPPAPPSAIRGELPGEIDTVIMRALSKDPGERYGTCREFVGAAAAALEPAPQSATASGATAGAGSATVLSSAGVPEPPASTPPAAIPSSSVPEPTSGPPTILSGAGATGTTPPAPPTQADTQEPSMSGPPSVLLGLSARPTTPPPSTSGGTPEAPSARGGSQGAPPRGPGDGGVHSPGPTASDSESAFAREPDPPPPAREQPPPPSRPSRSNSDARSRRPWYAAAAVLVLAAVVAGVLLASSSSTPSGELSSSALAQVPTNHVTGSGSATVRLNGDVATVTVATNGLDNNDSLVHAMHIHAGGKGECPPASAARDHNGHLTISTTDGIIYYGPPVVALTTSGNTGPGNILAFNRFLTGGTLHYARSFTLPASVASDIRHNNAVVVVHGVDYDGSGIYSGVLERSELDKSVPATATAPALCGVLLSQQKTTALNPDSSGSEGVYTAALANTTMSASELFLCEAAEAGAAVDPRRRASSRSAA